MKNKVTTDLSNPTVNLAINKSRIKKYGKKKSTPTYYLKKGQEFQIELYNPTQGKVLAEIKLNGIVNGGLILRAGERIFLDRYLDSNNKFLFDTYYVDDDETTKKAIELNGDLEVKFFKEITPSYNYWGGMFKNQFSYSIGTGDINPYYTNTTSSGNIVFNSGDTNLYNVELTANDSFTNEGIGTTTSTTSNSLETGVVDKGSISNQKLEYGAGNFNTFSFHDVEYKILPISQKKTTTSEYYKKYCGNCGAKCKTKFCSQCGAKQ